MSPFDSLRGPHERTRAGARTLRVEAAVIAASFVWTAVAGAAGPLRGDLAFPLEGWALVAQWSVGAGARSVREGWLRREYNDRGWEQAVSGSPLASAADGLWFRNAFRAKSSGSSVIHATFRDLPVGARVFLNGKVLPGVREGGETGLTEVLRGKTNLIAVFCPPHAPGEGRVPEVSIVYRRQDGSIKRPAPLRKWRVRRESIEREVQENWLRRADASEWKIRTPLVPLECDGWFTGGPVCVKAILDVPYYWRKRPITVMFHSLPGEPDVYLNGVKVAGKLATPWKYDASAKLKFDGRDTLCLVFPAPPSCTSGTDGRWGMVALHWEAAVRLPSFRSGSRVLVDASGGARQEGMRQALRFASELLAMSSTVWSMEWVEKASGTAFAAALVASWPTGSFSSTEISAADAAAQGRVESLRRTVSAPLWLVTPPTAGKKASLAANERMATYCRKAGKWAEAAGVRVLPVFDVFRSALRRQKRWPARPDWSDGTGFLTTQGSYLAALVLLDNLAMP